MPEIIGVKFRNNGKAYYFDPSGFEIRYHDHVIVETARGVEYGTVIIPPTNVPEERVTTPLRGVLRMATEEDDIRERENEEHEKEAFRICREKIREHGLDMKLICAEYTFDNSKVLFYFTADGRIDFRDLVKDLASIFRTRIELRQIGVRDETKILGGIGSCGRPLCCHTWLTEFAPVSIKMAKDQNLSLNPTKISGCCGRLMCCLKNEADTYASLNKGLPGKGDYVTTPDGLHGDVHSVNILRQKVKVIVELGNDEKELREFDVDEITFVPKSKRPKKDAAPQGGKKAETAETAEKEKESGRDRRERGGRPEKTSPAVSVAAVSAASVAAVSAGPDGSVNAVYAASVSEVSVSEVYVSEISASREVSAPDRQAGHRHGEREEGTGANDRKPRGRRRKGGRRDDAEGAQRPGQAQAQGHAQAQASPGNEAPAEKTAREGEADREKKHHKNRRPRHGRPRKEEPHAEK